MRTWCLYEKCADLKNNNVFIGGCRIFDILSRALHRVPVHTHGEGIEYCIILHVIAPPISSLFICMLPVLQSQLPTSELLDIKFLPLLNCWCDISGFTSSFTTGGTIQFWSDSRVQWGLGVVSGVMVYHHSGWALSLYKPR